MKPQLTASAVEITPTSRMRSMKMRLRSTRPCTRPVKVSISSRISSRRFSQPVGQVVRQAADAAVAVGDAGAGQVGEVLVDVVADRDQVQERGHRAEFHQRGGDAGQVVGDARVLGQQRAQVPAARRNLDAHQLLDRLAVGEVVDQRRAVVEPVDVGDQVVPGVRLALLLEARGAGSRSARRCAPPARPRARPRSGSCRAWPGATGRC